MEKYKDATQSVESRVGDLIERMTLKEKVGQLNQRMHGWNAFKIEDSRIELTEEFREEVAFGDGLGAIYGVSRADGWNSHVTDGITTAQSVRVANELQKYIIENTRLGIPLLLSEECPHGHEALESTTFPTNIGIGSSWNPDLYEKVCRTIAKELRSRGGHLGLISTLDIATDPRWGRTEECYSEDPHLAGRFCEKAVTGMQGTDRAELKRKDRVVSVLKHFCAQGATMGGHNGKSTNIGPRELREIHLTGMRKGSRAGALGCMAAYNDIDGVPCHINHELLTEILRDEMGFEGFVMSDGRGVDRFCKIMGSMEKAGAAAVHAGVDLNLWNEAFLELEGALEKGELSPEDLDKAVSRILTVKFLLGLFEDPYLKEEDALSVVGSPESKETALEIAREVPVLLENGKGTLPLKGDVKNIAVIGPNADKIYNQLGDYTQWQAEGKVVTVLEGIKRQAPEGVRVEYAHGCSVRSKDTSESDEALTLARKSDAVVLVLGGSSTREANMTFEDNGAVFMNQFTSEIDCGEAVDLADVELGGVQVELARELKKTGTPLIVVLIQGRPHAVPWLSEKADALLCAWYPGERGGDAVGEILFGKTVPSGRLSMSVPRSSAQLPVYYNRKDETDYVDLSAKALYPFGYGLSYTDFEYSGFRVNHKSLTSAQLEEGDVFSVTFTITNTGGYDGKEVPQLYIHDVESCVTTRIKELKDFDKVPITRGESAAVTLKVGREDLCVYDYGMNFVLEPGNVKLMVGKSSDEILFEETVQIK